jgi:cytochrome c biogenesis protein CcmG/thiol:disulfide interchange protein DsbE
MCKEDNRLISAIRLVTFLITLFAIAVFQAAVAEPAPDFTIPHSTGTTTLKELRGRVVYLDFWASWCTPCLRSFPWMNEMKAKYADRGLEIISVNLDQERVLAETFLQQVPASFTVVYDPAGELATRYGLKGMPTSFLIDRQGKLRYHHIGFLVKKQKVYEAEIEQLLQEAAH